MKVLISGYYGFGNVGDEAVLEAIIRGLKKRAPEIEITVLSAAPRLTAELQGVPALPRFRPFVLLRAIKETDVLLSGGGTLFQDATSNRSLWYYLAVVALAKMMGKKVMIFAQGFGPIERTVNKLLVKIILNRVDLITVREHDSESEMRKLGITRPRLEVTGDPTAILQPQSLTEGRRALSLEGIALNRPLVGIAPRSIPHRPDLEEQVCRRLAQELDHLVAVHNFQPVFLLFQCPEDLRQANRIMALMEQKAQVVFRICRPDEMLTLVAAFDLLIGMRLHSLIFAALSAVPMIGLSYDPKVKSFMGMINQPCLDLDELAQLGEAVDRVTSRTAEIKQKLTGVRESLSTLAARNFALFALGLAR
jgi:polysaccharide pyruvyl transferase CsaB